MAVGQPARLERSEVGFSLGERDARSATAARTGERPRGAGELAVERGQRALRRREVGLDAAQLRPVRAELRGNRRGSADQLGVRGLEGQAALLGVVELLLPLGELLVEELD